MARYSDSEDPRPTWDRMSLIAKLVPGWILRPICGAAISFFYRRSVREGHPIHQGVCLLTEGVNADLYLQRLKTALDLLSVYAPLYLRWLRLTFQALFISQLFMTLSMTTSPIYGARLLMIHPHTAWKASAEELALYLAAEATRGRLGPRFRRSRGTTRVDRIALREMITCAGMLPSSEPLIARLEQYLADFDRQYPEAAA